MSATAKREVLGAASKIAGVALPAAGVGILKGGRAVTGMGAAAGLGASATVAAIGVAFGVGYAIGTGLRYLWQRLQPEERNYRKALAFRHARDEFARTHGRLMSADEVRAMGRGFLQSLSGVS